MIIGIILVVAIIFRLVNINQSLWLDEATQVLLSQKSATPSYDDNASFDIK